MSKSVSVTSNAFKLSSRWASRSSSAEMLLKKSPKSPRISRFGTDTGTCFGRTVDPSNDGCLSEFTFIVGSSGISDFVYSGLVSFDRLERPTVLRCASSFSLPLPFNAVMSIELVCFAIFGDGNPSRTTGRSEVSMDCFRFLDENKSPKRRPKPTTWVPLPLFAVSFSFKVVTSVLTIELTCTGSVFHDFKTFPRSVSSTAVSFSVATGKEGTTTSALPICGSKSIAALCVVSTTTASLTSGASDVGSTRNSS